MLLANGVSPVLLSHPSISTNFDLPSPSSLLQSIEHLAIHVESKGKEKATVTEDVITHDGSQAKLSDAVAEVLAIQSIEAQNHIPFGWGSSAVIVANGNECGNEDKDLALFGSLPDSYQ
ncbi:hypothetical protein BOTCAL_0244g00110 [Botryotinia calthae]|uniref:Uncharacterized protein n=1 Tax=Botryotinia calthae TaxID=38488 RepID=A0A4Y8CWW1_9HELO|nr:hypothetical protein BOTCAL_0244g00110 [Botryotinia calthae]